MPTVNLSICVRARLRSKCGIKFMKVHNLQNKTRTYLTLLNTNLQNFICVITESAVCGIMNR